MRSWKLALVGLVCFCGHAHAQENTGEVAKAAHRASAKQSENESLNPHAVTTIPGRHVYDMPPVYGATAVVPSVKELQLIGSYKQPRWTSFRRFANTRSYVRPAGTFAFEYWWENKTSLRDATDARNRSQFEVEFGLGYRLQLDVYLQTEQLGLDGSYQLQREKLELRYALADWGKIFLNPTLYFEVVRQRDAPVKLEGKLLLAEQFGQRWFFASNLVFERELGGGEAHEYQLTTALAYSMVDSRFSLGAEVKLEMVDAPGARFAFDAYEALAGPTLFWSPVDPMRVLFVALLGAEVENGQTTGLFEPTLIFGWEI
ncbi:MAG: hypothetical protein IPJ88_17865 [Myxococcales bacterium]|nr:MAG: hypothetical protein IPJ88_17865 [Myxococcales bacterium]